MFVTMDEDNSNISGTGKGIDLNKGDVAFDIMAMPVKIS